MRSRVVARVMAFFAASENVQIENNNNKQQNPRGTRQEIWQREFVGQKGIPSRVRADWPSSEMRDCDRPR